MSYNLNQISEEVCVRAPRIILLGVEKIGKSTFASYADTPAMLPIRGEEGLDDPGIRKRAKVFPVCKTLGDVFGWLQAIYEQENNYQTVVIDSSSTLQKLINEVACKRLGLHKDGSGETENINKAGGGWGAGSIESCVIWSKITDWLDALRVDRNMASILTGHVVVKEFNDPNGESYDQYQWSIGPRAATQLFAWADCIMFANTKVIVKKTDTSFGKEKKQGIDVAPGSRFLYTQKRPAHPGGGRSVYGRLPYELQLGWDHFRDAVVAAM